MIFYQTSISESNDIRFCYQIYRYNTTYFSSVIIWMKTRTLCIFVVLNFISSHLSPLTLRSPGHHRWRCNNTFPPFPVLRCPQGGSKLPSCPFLDVIFPSLLLPTSPSCSFHCPLQNCLCHARGS